MPCSPSLHQSNCGMPSRSMAGEPLRIICDFSSIVSREHKSRARSSELRLGFWYGSCAAAGTAAAITTVATRILKFLVFIKAVFSLCDFKNIF